MANKEYNEQTTQGFDQKEEETTEPTYQDFMPGQLMDLDVKVKSELTKMCKKGVEAWLTGSDGRFENLKRWNELLEGVIEQNDFPWEGASSLHIPLIAIQLVTLHSIVTRSILTVDPLWYARTLDRDIKDKTTEIETAMSYKAKSELNTIEAVRDVGYTAPRDGIGWLQVTWAEETTPIETIERFETVKDFKDKYPTPESCGSTPEEYQKDIENIEMNASVDTPVEIPVSYDHLDYRGPKDEVVEEADMVRAPITAKTIKDCRIYGKRTEERIERLRERADEGELWKEEVEYFCKGKSKPDTDNSYRAGKNLIEGITDGEGDFSDERELYELVVRYKMPGSKRETRILCTYSHDKKKLLGASKYPYIKDNFIPFRFIKRPGRMAGISIPERLEDMNEAMDASINYEINAETIELSPIFKGKKSSKDDFDPEAEENRINPGTVLWLEEPQDFDQFIIKASDKRSSAARRQEIMRYAELVIGPTQSLSGRESSVDPQAPAKKTIALIQQSNMRVGDYIDEFRLGFDALGDMHLSLYYQFGGGILEYEDRDGNTQELAQSILRGMPKMVTHGVTPYMNPEVAFAKAMQEFMIWKNEPDIYGDRSRRRELYNRLADAGRIENKEALIPPLEEVQLLKEKDDEKAAEGRVIQKLMDKGLLNLPGGGAPPPLAPPPPGALPPGGQQLPLPGVNPMNPINPLGVPGA